VHPGRREPSTVDDSGMNRNCGFSEAAFSTLRRSTHTLSKIVATAAASQHATLAYEML
jgi:hypothetical protein